MHSAAVFATSSTSWGVWLRCVAVRQSGIFTAVIQPPLILFIAVPFAYFVFHGSTFTGIKDALINYGYPLIERFPLMFFTSATVLADRHGPLVCGSRGQADRDDPRTRSAVVDVPEDEYAEQPRRRVPPPRRSASTRSSTHPHCPRYDGG